jgi:hypothetical protein
VRLLSAIHWQLTVTLELTLFEREEANPKAVIKSIQRRCIPKIFEGTTSKQSLRNDITFKRPTITFHHQHLTTIMRADYFLVVPFLATLFNFMMVLLIQHGHRADAEPLLRDVVIPRDANEECLFNMNEYADALKDLEPSMEEQYLMSSVDQPDPMLAVMPGTNFKAYRRADIATFYREEPGSRVETQPEFQGQAGKFINMSPFRVSLYWVGADGPSFNANIGTFMVW